MPPRKTYSVRLWNRSTGLAVGEIKLGTDSEVEATTMFLGFANALTPLGYGLALMEGTKVNDVELQRTKA